MLKTTPFHSRTAPLVRGQAWRRWAGYVVASSYDLVHDLEYAAIRGAAALIDVTPLFKYRLRGPDAGALLDRDGFGLHAMRGRIELIGGTLSISSAAGSGTRIVAEVPVPPGREPAKIEFNAYG